MKKTLIIFNCFIGAAALLLWISSAQAYQFYSNNIGSSGGCADCHGAFRSGTYVSPADGSSWGGNLHDGHLNAMTYNSCNICHYGAGTSGRQVNLSSSNTARDGVNAISCSGCHGRLEDANGIDRTGTGWGAGLRQHHYNSGITECLGCHDDSDPSAFTPAGEDTMPAWYSSVTNRVSGTTLDPCNTNGAEHFKGSAQGNDNDGDGLYDGDDPDCQVAPECTADTDCDDGVFCNGAETCDANGSCQAGTPELCDDGVNCTIDSCDAGADACVNQPDNGACADNNNCTDDTCTSNGCTNDPVVCSAPGEQCDPADGACKECLADADCDDGVFCNGAETCNAGSCQAGNSVLCDDGVSCTEDICDESSQSCVNVPNSTVCDDGDPCTDDSCDEVNGCSSTPVVCSPGQQCDPSDGICKTPPECTIDANCDDGNVCNGAETCDANGSCQAGTALVCDDGNVCNGSETCDPNNGCQSGTALVCDDGNVCNGSETCDPNNGCQAGTTVSCSPGEQCDPTDGICKTPPECTSNADCDDGQFCNGLETCDASGSCQAGTPVVCDDGVACTDDICNEGSDSCVSSTNDANCTDDGQFCTGNEYCDATAGCISAGDPCGAGESCNESTDFCDVITGGCSEGDFPVIVITEYNEKAGKLNIEGFASEGSTITIENVDNGQVLAEGINVRNGGSWKAIINKLNTIPDIRVISSNGCSVDLFIGYHDDDHHDDD